MFKKVLIGCITIAIVNAQELTCSQVTQLASQYFTQNSTVVNNMVCISYYESSWNETAFNPSGATGLWQIMEDHCSEGSICSGICTTQQSLYNPDINAQCAVAVFEAQGYDAWTTYDDGDCSNWSGCSSNTGTGDSNSNTGSSNSQSSGTCTGTGTGTGTGSSNSGSNSGLGVFF